MSAVRPTVIPPQITAAMGAEPTEEQWRAISWPLEPCVLIAGAGSGKTSVMAARVVYLALVALGGIDGVDPEQGVLPGNVLCLTFTNKATENLRLRVRRALSALELAEGEEPEVQNYHGFAAVSGAHGVLAGIEPGASGCLTQAQRSELLRAGARRMTFEHVSASGSRRSCRRSSSSTSRPQNHRVDARGDQAYVAARLELLKERVPTGRTRPREERHGARRGRARFRELKRELGVIDFGDQIDAGDPDRRAASRGRGRVTARGSAPCSSTSTRTRTWRRPT